MLKIKKLSINCIRFIGGGGWGGNVGGGFGGERLGFETTRVHGSWIVTILLTNTFTIVMSTLYVI